MTKVKMRLALAASAAAMVVAGLAGGAAAQAAPQAASAPSPLRFDTVTCLGGSFCWATAHYYTEPGHIYVPLIEQWNGKTWRIVPSPAGYTGNVTCGGPSFCLAAVVAPGQPVTDVVWDGRAWQQFKPQPPNLNVSCFSATFCVVPDEGFNSDGVAWNGKAWQGMPIDSGGCGGGDCTYDSFGCGSATICWATGSYCATSDCDGGLLYFSGIWNGTAWNASSGRGLGFPETACAGRSFCLDLEPPTAMITNNWGATWHSSSAHLAAACHQLGRCTFPWRPSCASASFCLALVSPDPTAVLAWNGTMWRVVRLARVNGRLPKLTWLSCGSARDCVATGTYQPGPRTTPRSVVEHWNGKAWQVTKTPGP
jgi:hypothetical protein